MLHLSTLNHYPDHSAKFVKFCQFPCPFLILNFLKYLSFLYCLLLLLLLCLQVSHAFSLTEVQKKQTNFCYEV